MIVKRWTTKIVKDTYLIMPDNNKNNNPNLAIEIIVTLREFLGLVCESLVVSNYRGFSPYLCYFWDLEKFALAKNCISKIFILCTQ